MPLIIHKELLLLYTPISENAWKPLFDHLHLGVSCKLFIIEQQSIYIGRWEIHNLRFKFNNHKTSDEKRKCFNWKPVFNQNEWEYLEHLTRASRGCIKIKISCIIGCLAHEAIYSVYCLRIKDALSFCLRSLRTLIPYFRGANIVTTRKSIIMPHPNK